MKGRKGEEERGRGEENKYRQNTDNNRDMQNPA